jgi:uncharacterized protein (UPF0548 family)
MLAHGQPPNLMSLAVQGHWGTYDRHGSRKQGRSRHWHVDSGTTVIGREAPGPPEAGGAWEIACRLVSEYEFADARILRGVYRRDAELLGRNMLLEARFCWLRFYLGVRVTGVLDEERDTGDGRERVWGWCYQTLDGHLEQGRLSYEVIKNLSTGLVSFRVAGYSRRAPISNPVIRWGFSVFGRWTQQRFYRNIQARMAGLVATAQRGGPLPAPEAQRRRVRHRSGDPGDVLRRCCFLTARHCSGCWMTVRGSDRKHGRQ